MADPILTAAGDPVRHAIRDVIGVQSSGDERGINAELQFVRDVHPVQVLEHHPGGIHNTPKIARCILFALWSGTAYSLHPRSYLLGVYGGNVASLSRTSDGVISVTLAQPLGGVTYRGGDASSGGVAFGSDARLVRASIATISSATQFIAHRFQGTRPADLAKADGDFTLRIYSE